MRSASLLLALAITGCSPGDVGLLVDLKTDLVPTIEFDRVRTRVETADEAQRPVGEASRAADRADDARYEGGVRVAELTVPTGNLLITVELLDRAGNVIVSRRVLQSVSGTTAVSVVIARTCVGTSCPGAGDDPSATECAGRLCVPPECVSGDEPGCERECTVNGDCPLPAECASAVCVNGACFAASDGTTCGEGMFCHSALGCLDDPGALDAGALMTDAGTLDAGTLDASVLDAAACGDCDDANPCTDDACESGACTHTNSAASCDDGVFCNGADQCEMGSCAVHAGSPCVGATVCSEAEDTCTGCVADTDCPDPTMTSWDACAGFTGGTCDETGTRSRSITTYRCESGTCAPSTSSESESCSRTTTGTMCGATMTGTWAACGGFTGGACDETGTRTRSVTTYACAGGACAPSTMTETGSCTRDTDGITGCAATMTGTWSACGGFTGGTCDETGTRTRSVTTYACGAGSCAPSTTTETGSCTRDTDGTTGCAATMTGTWSACGGFSDVCDETGTRTRSVTTYACGAGSCAPTTTTETGSCTRADTDGTSCGTTVTGAFGPCQGFLGQCGESGTRMRTITTYTCGGGTCGSSTTTDTAACMRNSDGIACNPILEFPCTTGGYCMSGACRPTDDCPGTERCCEFGCRSGLCD